MKSAFVAAALLLAPAAASAAASTADLEGRWDAYVFGSQPEGSYTLRCILRINASGRLRQSTCNNDSSLAGRFTVKPKCGFNLAITQTFGPGQTIRCSFCGTLAQSKDQFSATGECSSSAIALVNGIKR